MGAIKIKGSTSGSTTITAPATGSDETIELSTALASKLDLAGGKILQIVRATDTTQRETTSGTFVDVTGMSVTITPQKSDSAILVIANVFVQTFMSPAGFCSGALALTDSSNNGLSGAEADVTPNIGSASTGDFRAQVVMSGWSTPATTSATTYKLRFTAQASVTIRLRNNLKTGQIFAIEVSA